MSTASPPIAPPKAGGRLLLWTGLLVAVLGVGLYVWQLSADILGTPWYAPVLALLGTVLILLSLLRRRSLWRVAALLFTTFLLVGEYWFLYSYSYVPMHSSTALLPGHPFPEFTAARADGTPFTRGNLIGDQDTVLVFFRGHW